MIRVTEMRRIYCVSWEFEDGTGGNEEFEDRDLAYDRFLIMDECHATVRVEIGVRMVDEFIEVDDLDVIDQYIDDRVRGRTYDMNDPDDFLAYHETEYDRIMREVE